MICVPLLGHDPARRDRPIRTGRRDRPIIQLPSIALRVAVIVGIAAVMFGIVFFRLWFLQILSGQEFVAQANDNRLSSVKVVAPRGYIVDRKGETIVGNRAGEAVGIRLMDVPKGTLDQELATLVPILHMKTGELRKRIKDYLYPSTLQQNADGSWSSFLTWQKVTDGEITGLDLIVLKHDVSRKVVTYLKERTLQFPGVEIQDESLRSYPQGDMAAQVLGHLGEISAEQLKLQHFKGYSPGDVVGYDGLEFTYDKWLRGRDGVARIEVDAFGRPKQTAPVGGRMPDAGDTLVTTIDSKVQAAAEEALRTGISLAHANHQYEANGAAAVVMDVKNGDVLGMASYPTFDPNVWVGGMKQKTYKQLTRKASNYPLLNRATQETKAVGSTFKAITSVAALEEGIITPGTGFFCPGYYISPEDLGKTKFKCWALNGHGTLDLVGAITQSCDVYFYNVGDGFYRAKGTALEDWAVRLGMGKPTGIDIPFEAAGRVPTPAWKKRLLQDRDRQALEAERLHLPRGRPGQPRGHAAAARHLLRRDRQRRQGRHAAPRPQDHRRRRPDRPRSRADDDAQGRHRPDDAGRGQAGALRRGELARQARPPPSSPGTRSRWPARPARPRSSTTVASSTTPGMPATRRRTTRSTWSSS